MLGIRAGGLTTASRRTQVSTRDFYSSMKAHKLGLAVLEEKSRLVDVQTSGEDAGRHHVTL
mgnify:FL=1